MIHTYADNARDRLVPGRSGLQPQRTDRAWVRTAIAAMAHGGLLLYRHSLADITLFRLFGGLLAFTITFLALWIAHRRGAILRAHPLPVPLAPRREVTAMTLLAVILGGITLVVITRQ